MSDLLVQICLKMWLLAYCSVIVPRHRLCLMFTECYVPLYPCGPAIKSALSVCQFLPLYAWNKYRNSKHSFIKYILLVYVQFFYIFQFCVKQDNNDGHFPNPNTRFL
jgi:hypothetical protein